MITFKALPKYESLELNLPKIETNCLNVIVDLKVYLQPYYANMYRFTGEQNVDVADVVSRIMSIISHYRNYFFRNKGIKTKFYVLNSKEKCANILGFHPTYKKRIYQKIDNATEYVKACLNKALPLIENLVNYTEGCIFVDTSDFDENCYIRYIVDTSPEITLVLSKYPEAIMPVLNERAFVFETYSDRMLYYIYSKEAVARTLILGSQTYGIKSSHVSAERFDESWAPYIAQHQLLKADTLHNPIDYEKAKSLITKQPTIARLIYIHKKDQDRAYTILSGAAFYHANKKIIETKLLDTHPKYSYAEYCEVNDLFGVNPLNVKGLLRGYI